jgi:hypothetical protein
MKNKSSKVKKLNNKEKVFELEHYPLGLCSWYQFRYHFNLDIILILTVAGIYADLRVLFSGVLLAETIWNKIT